MGKINFSNAKLVRENENMSCMSILSHKSFANQSQVSCLFEVQEI